MELSKRLRAEIGQKSDLALTGLLLTVAIVTILVALFAPRLVKIGVLAWEVFP